MWINWIFCSSHQPRECREATPASCAANRFRQPELFDRLLQSTDHSRTGQTRVGLNTCWVNATTMTRMRLPHPVARHHRQNPRPLWFELISSRPSLAGRTSRFLLNRRAMLFPSSHTTGKFAGVPVAAAFSSFPEFVSEGLGKSLFQPL
jgi:hypothetical protein